MPASDAAEAGRHRGIVQPGAPALVEAGDDFHGRRTRRAVHSRQVLEQLLGGQCELLHAAFEEVPGERGLGQGKQVRRGLRRREAAEQLAETPEVLLVRALPGPELRDGDSEHGWKIIFSER